jgi:hypothetical protein
MVAEDPEVTGFGDGVGWGLGDLIGVGVAFYGVKGLGLIEELFEVFRFKPGFKVVFFAELVEHFSVPLRQFSGTVIG